MTIEDILEFIADADQNTLIKLTSNAMIEVAKHQTTTHLAVIESLTETDRDEWASAFSSYPEPA